MLEGAFVIELTIERLHLSRAERVHGGVLFSSATPRKGGTRRAAAGPSGATVEIKINYFRAVQNGILRAAARCVEKTRSIGYAEGEVVNEEGKLLARAMGTLFLTDSQRRWDR
jgi:acyl-CoA thioesterase